MTTDARNCPALPAFMALCLGIGAMFSMTTQAAEASQNMTSPPTSATTLSMPQQTIPLIAAFMASSDMPGLNTALNQGLDAGLSISEIREILVQLYAYVGLCAAQLRQVTELLKKHGDAQTAERAHAALTQILSQLPSF